MNPDTLQPLISVIIPTYHRPAALRQCLSHLAEQRYPRDRFEAIVVDDGSTEPPAGIVADAAGRLAVTLRTQSHAGPAAARNTGARYAAGDYLAFTDDDCAPAPDWLKSLAACWAESPEVGIGGRTLNRLQSNLNATASQVIVDLAYGFYNKEFKDAHFFASNNMALPTLGFREIGGFDESLFWSEDRELCDRWRQAGYRLIFSPSAVVYHGHNLTLSGFFRQHFNYGRGAFCYHRSRARRGAGRLRDDMRFHVELPRKLVAIFAATPPRRWIGIASLLVMWQLANTAGYLYERSRRPAKNFNRISA